MSKASVAGIETGQEVPSRNPKVKLTYKTLLNKRGELSSFRCALFLLKILLLFSLFLYILTLVLGFFIGFLQRAWA